MKKNLKNNLSVIAALALSVSLGLSQLVSAESEGSAASALKFLEKNQAVEDSVALYESWSKDPKYQKMLKEGDRAYGDLQKDTQEWARLKTLRCNALLNQEKLTQLLNETDHFVQLAKGVVTASKELGGLQEIQNDQLVASDATLPTNTILFEEDLKALESALKENQEAAKQDLKEEIGKFVEGTYGDVVKKSAETFKKILEKVMDDDYQEAVVYLKGNYNESAANKTKSSLQARITEQKGLVAFVEKIAEETGFSLEGGCALGEENTPSTETKVTETTKPQKQDVQKDKVPNTGAHA